MAKKGEIKNRVGEVYIDNCGEEFVIIALRNNKDVDIQFKDGTILKNRQMYNIRKEAIKNPNRPSVCSVGFIGIGKHLTYIGKVETKKGMHWRAMIKRSYDKTQSAYDDVTVCEEWKCFQNFAEWFESNYDLEIMKGWDLDKDILKKGNKIYSPETCCFVPQEINGLFTKRNKLRGDYPIGVHKEGNRYIANLGKINGRNRCSRHNTPEEAFEAYKTAKEIKIKQVADKWKPQITEECYQTLINYKVEITD